MKSKKEIQKELIYIKWWLKNSKSSKQYNKGLVNALEWVLE